MMNAQLSKFYGFVIADIPLGKKWKMEILVEFFHQKIPLGLNIRLSSGILCVEEKNSTEKFH